MGCVVISLCRPVAKFLVKNSSQQDDIEAVQPQFLETRLYQCLLNVKTQPVPDIGKSTENVKSGRNFLLV